MTIWNVLFLFYSIAKIMIFQNKKRKLSPSVIGQAKKQSCLKLTQLV